MKYVTTIQIAEKWNISQRRVAILCAQNRIPGAVKAGKTWLIPSDCEKPKDERFENSSNDNIGLNNLSTYPKGFFKLFGCAPNLDFPDNIDDFVPEDVTQMNSPESLV